MKKLLNSAVATVDIKITGAAPEELANHLAADNVEFWNVQRVDALCWHMTMYAADYLKIRPLAKKAMCHTRVLARHGFPFFARKMKKRRLLLVGLTLCIAAAIVLPMFVWTYTVEGNDTVSDQQILRALDEIGVGIGTFGPSIRPVMVKTKMLLKIPELAWLTVNVSGGRATVVVREERAKPDILNENMVTDLVASATGVITKMEIRRGRETVAVGQTVLEGETLVSGVIEHRSYERLIAVQTVRSMGEVYARTWRKLTALTPLEYGEKRYTGRTKEKFSLLLGKKKVNFFADSGNLYEEYDKITERKYLTLPGGISFPVGVERTVICEYESSLSTMPEDRAEAMLGDYLMESMKSQMAGGQILKTDFSGDCGSGVITVSAVFECLEQIAREVAATVPEYEISEEPNQ